MTDIFTFSLAKPEHAAEAFAMIQTVKRAGLAGWDEDYPSLDFMQEDAQRGELYLLRDGAGTLAACITLIARPEELEEIELAEALWLPAASPVEGCRLCVAAGLQGRGVGEEMMRRALEAARTAMHDSFRLLCAEDNPRAIRLYERLGFRRGGRVSLYDWDFRCYDMAL